MLDIAIIGLVASAVGAFTGVKVTTSFTSRQVDKLNTSLERTTETVIQLRTEVNRLIKDVQDLSGQVDHLRLAQAAQNTNTIGFSGKEAG